MESTLGCEGFLHPWHLSSDGTFVHACFCATVKRHESSEKRQRVPIEGLTLERRRVCTCVFQEFLEYLSLIAAELMSTCF